MKLTIKTAIMAATLALVAAPAMALPPQAPSNNGTGHAPSDTPSGNTPGPHAGLPAKAKTYGRYCQSFGKKHVAGTPGTPVQQVRHRHGEARQRPHRLPPQGLPRPEQASRRRAEGNAVQPLRVRRREAPEGPGGGELLDHSSEGPACWGAGPSLARRDADMGNE